MFNNWSSSCIDSSKQLNIVAADGKVMRGSMDRIKNTNAKQILSLFATTSKITLAQQEIDTKSNEIPALLELLETLELKDAMHNQKKTLQAIIDKSYHFVSQVKNNQKNLLEQIKYNTNIPNTKPIDTYIENDFNTHGRYEN